MKEQIERLRKEEGGFTLAELLIVVAIILVLVAIAIPVFTSSLHSSHVAADQANCRSLYADLQADYLGSADKADYTATTFEDAADLTFTDGEKATLAAGKCTVTFTDGAGYTVEYTCNDAGHSEDGHTWGAQAADSTE